MNRLDPCQDSSGDAACNFEPSEAELLRDQMQEVFGTDIWIWSRTKSSWTSCQKCPRDRQQLSRLLETHADAWTKWCDHLSSGPCGEPQVFSFDAAQGFVGVKCEQADEVNIVGGLVEFDGPKLAQLAAANALQRVAAIDQQELIDQYAIRLTSSFEELCFLRRLSKHLELCVADRTLADTSKLFLPQLHELLNVEAVVFVPVGEQLGTPADNSLLGSTETLPGDASFYVNLIRAMSPAAGRAIVNNDPANLRARVGQPPAGLRSFALTSIEKDGFTFGWLIAVNKRLPENFRYSPNNSLGHDEIGSMEASLLESAALMLASNAANNRLLLELEALIVNVVITLVGAIEAKDPYTCGHSTRVAQISKRIAQQLGLNESECQDIHLAGLLHDIGKLGVPDRILQKPGRLEDHEFAVIKKHPEIGAQLLKGLKPLERLIPGVLYHHEAIDGSGYPIGMKSDEIPLTARILAVADAFDAMTSDRPYRTGMSIEKAEGIIYNGAGTQWDLEVVEAFLQAREDIAVIIAKRSAESLAEAARLPSVATSDQPLLSLPVPSGLSMINSQVV